ncbi:MAG: hypothetical protein RBR97_17175, partial [Bacteroidales bacterium]|nr:hypothetical protein [Bacteroidales bacterium]
MKKILIFLIGALLLSVSYVNAQVVDGITYQAVAVDEDGKEIAGMDANGNILHSKTMNVRFTIIEGSSSGNIVYQEIHSTNTDPNGLFSVIIGHGEITNDSSNLSILDIDWGGNKHFLKVELDVKNRNEYKLMGIQQMMAVPYAFHAKTAETVTVGITETDPVFTAWDKSTGISITESQISDLGTYIETETDPVFTAWDKSTGITITESQINDLGNYVETETDPVFTAWDKSTGITITESQINDLGNYVETETDPVFTAWDKSTGISITKSQISDLGTYIETETDPVFTAWDKSTGISITESQISDLGNYIETETDPAVAANFDFTDAANGDLLQFNGTKWVKVTPTYISDYTVTESDVTSHQAALSITESQISDLGNYIETETDPAVAANFDFTDAANGDLLQFNGTKWVKVTPTYISDYTVTESDVTSHQAALSITESQISDLGNYIETETDPSVPIGTQIGEMQYWNGIAWVTVAATENEGATLQMIGGIPTWVGGTPPTPNVT